MRKTNAVISMVCMRDRHLPNITGWKRGARQLIIRKSLGARLMHRRSHFLEEVLNNELSLGDFTPGLKQARTAYAKFQRNRYTYPTLSMDSQKNTKQISFLRFNLKCCMVYSPSNNLPCLSVHFLVSTLETFYCSTVDPSHAHFG